MEQYLSNLERALLRNQQRIQPTNVKPTVVTSVTDLQRVLSEIAPHNPAETVTLRAVLDATDENHKRVQYAVTAPTKSKSKRETLIEGLDVIKKQMEVATAQNAKLHDNVIMVNDKPMAPPLADETGAGMSWVDPLIRQWLGGRREGLYIHWTIGGEEFKYDIYQHRLVKVLPPQPVTEFVSVEVQDG